MSLEEIKDIRIHGGNFPGSNEEKLGRDYDAELLVSSRGNFIYHCFCGTTSYGSLFNINMSGPYLNCLDLACGAKFDISEVASVSTQGPSLYKIKRVKEK